MEGTGLYWTWIFYFFWRGKRGGGTVGCGTELSFGLLRWTNKKFEILAVKKNFIGPQKGDKTDGGTDFL